MWWVIPHRKSIFSLQAALTLEEHTRELPPSLLPAINMLAQGKDPYKPRHVTVAWPPGHGEAQPPFQWHSRDDLIPALPVCRAWCHQILYHVEHLIGVVAIFQWCHSFGAETCVIFLRSSIFSAAFYLFSRVQWIFQASTVTFLPLVSLLLLLAIFVNESLQLSHTRT